MRKALPMAALLFAAACQTGCFCFFLGDNDDDHPIGDPPAPPSLCAAGPDCGVDSCCYQGSCYPSTPSSPGPCAAATDCPAGQSCDAWSGLCSGADGGDWSGGYSTSGGSSGTFGGGSSGGSSGTSGTSGGSTSGGSTSGGAIDAGLPALDGGCVKDLSGVLVGNPCASDADCGPGGACGPALNLASGLSPTVWTGGYCTAVGCGPNAPCPKGSTCFTLPGSSTEASLSVCLADCGQPACRRPGYDCSAVGSIWACLPECATDQDCGAGLVCDGAACAPPCGTRADCGPGEICSDRHCLAGPPQSCCSCEPCPNGQSCVAGFCATACTADADCPAGERCGSSGSCG